MSDAVGGIQMPVDLSDGKSVHLMSYAGGASPNGLFGQIELWFCRKGSTEPEKRVTYVPVLDRRPKLVVLGHAGHGKDTVCELLRDRYGYSFMSSSLLCAERVVLQACRDAPDMPNYSSPQHCFEDRSNHRKFWFDAITAYNTPDRARLGRLILNDFDVYCGVRNRLEFEALRSEALFDVAIWVDGSARKCAENEESCTVTRNMADFVLDNNGTLDCLGQRVHNIMRFLTP